MYFRELPNPLFTYQLYGKFVECVECVQDKNQRILRLHEIVQQLPPPHYRCRDLEVSRDTSGAFLRSVNIQAVILEYLIRYADIIFNHKMPTWRTHSAQVSGTGNPSRRRQRPQSMACSPLSSPSPSKLIDLGEAQRKFLAAGQEKIPPGTGLPDLTNRKCIDVNGGPAAIEGKYHTVIDFPQRGGKRPGGWRALFGGRGARKPRIGGPAPIIGAPMPLAPEGPIMLSEGGGHRQSDRSPVGDHGPIYGSLQHVHMKGWDARVRQNRRNMHQRESEGEKERLGNRSMEEERIFSSQPDLRPVQSAEALLRTSGISDGNDDEISGRGEMRQTSGTFRNDAEYDRVKRAGRDSSSEYNRETSTSRETTPMAVSTTSESSSSATAGLTATGNNPASPSRKVKLFVSQPAETLPSVIPKEWLPSSSGETTFEVVDDCREPSFPVDNNRRSPYSVDSDGLLRAETTGGVRSPFSDPGDHWLPQIIQSSEVSCKRNSVGSPVFDGGLAMHSPDLAENRRPRSAEAGFSLLNFSEGEPSDFRRLERLDLDRSAGASNASSIEALLTTASGNDDDDGMNSTADLFLVSSERNERAGGSSSAAKIVEMSSAEKSEGGDRRRNQPPIEPTILVVNNFENDDLGFSGNESSPTPSGFFGENDARGTTQGALSPLVVATENRSSWDDGGPASSVCSLSIFEREEEKLLAELRKEEYSPDIPKELDGNAEEVKEIFPELHSALESARITEPTQSDEKESKESNGLSDVFVQEDLACECTVKLTAPPNEAEDEILGITHKLDEQLVKHEVSEFSMEWNPNVELSIPVSKNYENNEQASREPAALFSRESSLDSEARNVFETVVEPHNEENAEGDGGSLSAAKPVLPARQRISFEDVNSLLESMENLTETEQTGSYGVAGLRGGRIGGGRGSRDRRPIFPAWNRDSAEESSDSEIRKSRYDNISSASDKSLNWESDTRTEATDTFSGDQATDKISGGRDSAASSITVETKPVPKPRISKILTTGPVKSREYEGVNKENKCLGAPPAFVGLRQAEEPRVASIGRLGGTKIAKKVAIFESQPDSLPELGVVRARPAVAMTQSLREIDFPDDSSRPAVKKAVSVQYYASSGKIQDRDETHMTSWVSDRKLANQRAWVGKVVVRSGEIVTALSGKFGNVVS